MCETCTSNPRSGTIRLDWSGVTFPLRSTTDPASRIAAIVAVRRASGALLGGAIRIVDGVSPMDVPEEHRHMFDPWVPLGLSLTEVKRKRGATKRRTCATPGCERIASGGAKHCRTCRAEKPIRAELATVTKERDDIIDRLARAANVDADAEYIIDMAEARVLAWDDAGESLVDAKRSNAILRTERDNATKALAIARDHARGQEVRLRRAKGDRDDAVATVQQLTEAVGALRIERDDWRSVAKKNANERGQAHMELASLKSLYGGLGQHHKVLRTRLHIMYAVAVLLGVAAVVGGVL